MLVYGDPVREVDPRALLVALGGGVSGLARHDPAERPIVRHGRLAALFIDAAELAQGLADAGADVAGGDGPNRLEAAAVGLLMPLSQALIASWRALGEGCDPPPPDPGCLREALAALGTLPLPASLRLRTGEGYAYYALYPEAYAEAARRAGLGPEATVVGIRSIGLGLAAIVAAACGAAAPLSVRPVGHPFRRELRLTAAMDGRFRTAAAGAVAIVDEGPGLSGSSFGATADALEARGASPERLVFFPSHGGDLGPEASPRHKVRWASARRPYVDVDNLLIRTAAPGQRLAGWFADLVDGEAELEDVSGGGWRAHMSAERDWPAVNSLQERRKFLLGRGDTRVLLKFSGLGGFGQRAFAAERRLAAAGFTPEPLAFRHGFVGRRWLEARPLRLESEERRSFAAHLGRYLGWRAACLPAPAAGAGAKELLQMARVNAVAALGAGVDRTPALDPVRWADLPPLRPVWTDNRLHRHEWLRTRDGRWLKCDGVDHALGHDLIGPQDVAWDVAGAVVEFELDATERSTLLDALSEQAAVSPDLAAALEVPYAAFQFAAHAMAVAAHAHWPQEQDRLSRAADLCRRRLAARLSA